MGAKNVVVGLLLAALATAGLFWFAQGDSAGLIALQVVAPAAQHGVERVPAERGSAPEPDPVASRAGLRTQAPATAAGDPRLAILRGRCVDERGEALAGCELTLDGRWRDREAREAWWREHGAEPDWHDQGPVATPAHGRFEFVFVVPPFDVSLHVAAEGLVRRVGHWSDLVEGAVVDLGDVVMFSGGRFVGRVVDEQGVPQPQLSLYFRRDVGDEAAKSRLDPVWYAGAVTGADGAFRSWVVPPGDYAVSVNGRGARLRSPENVTMRAGNASEVVDVVAFVPSDDDVIAGQVVDGAGRPVERVRVVARSGNFESHAESRSDGTFRLLRREGCEQTEAEVRLATAHHDVIDTEPKAVAWGARGLELQVRRGGTLTVFVGDEHGAPVELYSVRLSGEGKNRYGSAWSDADVRTRGPHEGGVATIEGLSTGSWLMIVEFPTKLGLATCFERFDHAGGDRRLDVRADPLVDVPVRVVTPTGEPVVGSTLHLCETFGKPLRAHRSVTPWTMWLRGNDQDKAAELAVATTDADGRAVLSAPIARDLGLRVHGPAQLPLDLAPVRFEAGVEFVVTAAVGARLTGRVVPAGAVPKLRALGGELRGDRPLRLGLLRADGQRFPEFQSDGSEFDIGDDGSFSVAGLPPGAWTASLRGWVGADGSASSHDFGGVAVDLREATTSEVTFDVGDELPGTLDALVELDGRPYVEGVVTLQLDGGGQNLRTDAEGRIRQDVRPGDYTAALQYGVSGRGVWLTCDTTFRIVPGEVLRPTIQARSGTLRVRLLRADGSAAAGVELQFVAEEGRRGIMDPQLAETDADGWTTLIHCGATGRLRTLPKRLSTRGGLRAYYEEAASRGERPPLDDLYVVVGEVVVITGQERELTLRLPESAGY